MANRCLVGRFFCRAFFLAALSLSCAFSCVLPPLTFVGDFFLIGLVLSDLFCQFLWRCRLVSLAFFLPKRPKCCIFCSFLSLGDSSDLRFCSLFRVTRFILTRRLFLAVLSFLGFSSCAKLLLGLLSLRLLDRLDAASSLRKTCRFRSLSDL